MKRWIKPALAGLMLVLSAGTWSQGVVREAPADVKPAMLAVTTPPVILLNGKPDRLSPGSRIRDTQNLLVMSSNLVGRNVPAVYRRDSTGLVHEVWLLTDAEYARLRGLDPDRPDGYRKLMELVELIFAARTMGIIK